MENNALYHHGTKGMRWGIRRYQNKDGSLTPAGQKRYNKEVEKLKKETAKVKAAEKVAATRKKTQTKLDKLEEKKAALEARKKALKDGKDPEETVDKKTGETPEEKKARLLKSTDPKELYENRDMLTTMELNERLNRIDTEARLSSKIVVEHQKTGMDYVDNARSKLDKGVAMYKSIDNAYSTIANSAIGKTLAKKLGIEPPKKEFDYDDFIKNINKKSTQEVMEFNKRALAEKTGKNAVKEMRDAEQKAAEARRAETDAKKAAKQAEKEAKKAEKEAKKAMEDAQKQVDDYNKRWSEGKADDDVNTSEYRQKSNSNSRDTIKTFRIEQKPTRMSDDDVEIIEPDWYTRHKSNTFNTTPSSVNSSTMNSGESFIFGYLEDRNGR